MSCHVHWPDGPLNVNGCHLDESAVGQQSNHRCAGAHHAPLRRRLKTGRPGVADLSSSFLCISNDGPPARQCLPQSSPYRENLKLGPRIPSISPIWRAGEGGVDIRLNGAGDAAAMPATSYTCPSWRARGPSAASGSHARTRPGEPLLVRPKIQGAAIRLLTVHSRQGFACML
jgi:hypothetical protein